MEFEQLRNFLQITQYDTITKAARSLGMTQPALSKSLSALEAELGVKLFYRESNRLLLNQYGQIVRQHSQRIFDSMTDAEIRLKDCRGEIKPEICMASSVSPADPNWILQTVGAYLREKPMTKLTHSILSIPEIQDKLLRRELDLAITTPEIQDSRIIWTPLYWEASVVVMSRRNPLATKEHLRLSDLEDSIIYCVNADSNEQSSIETLCRRAGFEPKIQFAADFPLYIAKCVSQNKCVAFVAGGNMLTSWHESEHYPWEEELVYRSLSDGSLYRRCGYAVLRNRYHTDSVRDFIAYMQQAEKPRCVPI